MGTHAVRVPDVGEGIAEVELVSWAVSVGDTVTRNQILAEVMTDKANVEIPSPVNGVIQMLNGDVGGVLAVGSTLVELGVEGADADVPATSTPTPVRAADPDPVDPEPAGDEAAPPAPPADEAAGEPDRAASSTTPRTRRAPVAAGARPARPEGEAPRASPAVRHRARQGGIDLRQVPGTGPAGRITHDDLDAYWRLHDPDRPDGGGGAQRRPNSRVEEQPIIGLRRQIARRMVASTQSIPHITYVDEVDVTALQELRAALNEERREDQPRLTILPFLIRAMVRHLPEFPQMNAHFDDEHEVLTTYGGVHAGIATQTPNGLVVPVVRHAEALSIWSLAGRIDELAEAARTGKAAPSDLSGSTITITSLGALGGLVTTPVINKPEVAIVGVNKIVTRPQWIDGEFRPRQMMNLSSSFDHRIVDGWDAASFVQQLRRSLEQPALLFVEDQ